MYLTVKVSSRKNVNIKQENVNIKFGVDEGPDEGLEPATLRLKV